MSKLYEKLETCLASVRKKTDFKPEVALILGSGLGDFADEIKIEATVDYTDIEGFPTSTVAGHKGRFVFGYVGSVPVVIMQGRVHYYEGYPMTDVVLPTRLMETILYLYEKCRALITRGMPVSILKEGNNIFEKIISIKYDVANNQLEKFDQYKQDIDTFYDDIMKRNG